MVAQLTGARAHGSASTNMLPRGIHVEQHRHNRPLDTRSYWHRPARTRLVRPPDSLGIHWDPAARHRGVRLLPSIPHLWVVDRNARTKGTRLMTPAEDRRGP